MKNCPTCGAPLDRVPPTREAIQRGIRDRLFVPGPVINRDGSVEYNEQDAVDMLRAARRATQEQKQ
jgi:hypothetical protein